MKNHELLQAARILAVAFVSQAATLHAADFTVQMRDFSFTPKNLTINVGDTVNWVNVSGSHDVQSNVALFKSPPPPVQKFSFTFTKAGTFAYRCNPHVNFGMTGSIIVNAPANTPPTVSITAPANGFVLSAPAELTITADAADGGSVAKVEFFDGATLLGTDASSPFSFVANFAAGAHTLTAKATDDGGLSTVSSPVAITVNEVQAGPITLANPGFAGNGQFTFQILGLLSSKPAVVQGSIDATTWLDVLSIATPANPQGFQDAGTAANAFRYYRVRQ